MNDFSLELLIPDRCLLSEKATMVVLPGTDGDIGILANHAPIMCSLRPKGVITIHQGDRTKSFAVSGGFAQAGHNRCTILADSADPTKS